MIPTIGRPECLQTCLESLAACDPRPDEVLVVDQSGGSAIEELVERFAASEVRAIPSASRGIAHAVNLGMREARNEQVAITHDDCSVAKDWVKLAARLIGADPEAIFSGQVLPGEGNGHVPSTIEDPDPREYSGVRLCDVLYPANMVCTRDGIFELGGFDERFLLLPPRTMISATGGSAPGAGFAHQLSSAGLARGLADAGAASCPLPRVRTRAGHLLRQAPASRRPDDASFPDLST